MINKMDGLELLRMIRDGEIKPGARIFDSDGNEYVYKEMFDGCVALMQKDKVVPGLYEEPCCSMFTDKDTEFTIVEDEVKEVDIDAIGELNDTCFDFKGMDVEEIDYYHNLTRSTLNEVIRAVKYLYNKGE